VAPSSGKRREFSLRTRQHTWDSLQHRTQPLDALIVGGGIVGAGCLREMALRGLTNALLIDKGDFASGTSSASSKLIHAGIRYLEQAWNRLKEGQLSAAVRDFWFVVEASSERKALRRLAPHLIRTKRIHLVLAAGDTRNPLSVMAGTWLYFFIQLLQGQAYERPRAYLNQEAIRRAVPEIDASKVRAVFTFADAETDDARLVIENLQDANDLGAAAMNYVELVSFEVRDDGVHALLRNRETEATARVHSRVLTNAAGASVDDVAARGGEAPSEVFVDRVAGSHIDVHPPLTENSYYVTASDGRLVFVLCRDEDGLRFTRIGTTERPLAPGESSDAPRPTQRELQYLVGLTNEFFPKSPVKAGDIIGTDAGIRPLRARSGTQSAFQKSREHEIVEEGPVYHIIGVKLTDYRRVAVEVMNGIRWDEHGAPLPSTPPSRPLRPAERGDRMYAEATAEQIVNQTMVLHWDDLALRRLGGRPRTWRQSDPAALDRFLNEMSRLMGWSPTQAAAERARFSAPTLP